MTEFRVRRSGNLLKYEYVLIEASSPDEARELAWSGYGEVYESFDDSNFEWDDCDLIDKDGNQLDEDGNPYG